MSLGNLGGIIERGLNRAYRDRFEIKLERRKLDVRIASPEVPPLERLRLSLGDREKIVLGKIGDGYNMERIATDSGRSFKTIETQRGAIVEKIRRITPNIPTNTTRLINVAIALKLSTVRQIVARDGTRLTHKAQLRDWEFELLILLGKGCTIKEIAEVLKMTTSTAERRKEILVKKLRPLAAEKVAGAIQPITIDVPGIVHTCRHERLLPPFDLTP